MWLLSESETGDVTATEIKWPESGKLLQSFGAMKGRNLNQGDRPSSAQPQLTRQGEFRSGLCV